jgi:hypothetical protein
VARNTDGRLEAFARGGDQALGTSWQTAANGGWAPWTSRGGSPAGDPSAVGIRGGRLEVFARGTNNALYPRPFAVSVSYRYSSGRR